MRPKVVADEIADVLLGMGEPFLASLDPACLHFAPLPRPGSAGRPLSRPGCLFQRAFSIEGAPSRQPLVSRETRKMRGTGLEADRIA